MTQDTPAEIRMANNIAANFGHLASEKAAAAVADHIGRFWDPRMKRRLFELTASGATDLDPVALAATALLR
jgi:formate dehydrogenase subunit delta